MPVMLSKLYVALKHAHVEDEVAVEAASEVAAYDNRIAKVEADLRLLTWMVGFNLALTVGIFVKSFWP